MGGQCCNLFLIIRPGGEDAVHPANITAKFAQIRVERSGGSIDLIYLFMQFVKVLNGIRCDNVACALLDDNTIETR